jgi:hypothetical protein
MNRQEAEAAGYKVDSHVYPWIAYKGPRYRPDEIKQIETDLEAARGAEVTRLRREVLQLSPVPVSTLVSYVETVRRYLHLQIGEPKDVTSVSATEFALDNLRRVIERGHNP